MQQLLQNLKTGKTELVEEPDPRLREGCFLIQTHVSLISAGTERMLLEFGKANYLAKAKSQPDKVKQVLDKVRTDGIRLILTASSAAVLHPNAHLALCLAPTT